MQVFGNAASPVQRKTTKAGKNYFEFRLAESQRSVPGNSNQETTWFTVRVMKDVDPLLNKGDFVKVTGKLKADFYLNREGKPTGTLLIIAFDASKIAKNAGVREDKSSGDPVAPKADVKEQVPAQQLERAPERVPAMVQAQEGQQETEEQHDSYWTSLYN